MLLFDYFWLSFQASIDKHEAILIQSKKVGQMNSVWIDL